MAEQKRTFLKGKQNRDLDDRILPSGEYRSAINAQVSNSESSDVGALENIRGNFALSNFVDDAAVVIGSIRQQSENRIFYFVVGSREDGIYEFSEETEDIRIIARSTTQAGVLKFSVDNLITGIDIIGEQEETLLFWTDGLNPPRRVNVERMVTRHQGRLDGVLTVDGEITLTGFTEEEISVVKQPDNVAPIIDIIEVDDLNPSNDSELDILREENLKEKFVRFATRRKYIDGEYSVISPWSEVPFSTGQFSFDRASGKLTCMENLVRKLEISFNTGPRDVTEVDLLYKSDDSSTVYVVESYVKAAEGWGNNVLLSKLNRDIDGMPIAQPVEFSSNKLYRALPTRDVDATFHNVPLTAKTQSIVNNRLVYGNYVDRYNIEDLLKTYSIIDGERLQTGERNVPIIFDLTVERVNNSLNTQILTDSDPDAIGVFGEKNLKSDRDYEIGIVYFDNVGRSTPVLTSPTNSLHIPIQRANKKNRIQVTIGHKAPHWATHYRFFIKTNRIGHYNIIPLDVVTQPDDNEFKWLRISQPDSAKVKEGDYLALKITNHSFTYANGSERLTTRIEEVGSKERNFLELEEPRVGREISATGETLNEGTVITKQKPGIWIKIRNSSLLGSDIDVVSDFSSTKARSNNARDLDNDPVIGGTEDHQDLTYYYPGSFIDNPEIDEESVTFSGTYTPGTGYNASAPAFTDASNFYFGPTLGDATSYPGPMRVKVTVEDDQKYIVEFFTSESADTPQIRRQLITLNALDLPAAATTVPLLNGVSITFNVDPALFNIGDSFTCVWRLKDNFMWKCWRKSGAFASKFYKGPNDVSRNAVNARRSHILVGAGQIEDGINGGSVIQFGVKDGLDNAGRDNLDGSPIRIPFTKNAHYTPNVFYDNTEEWLFETGLYSGTSGETLAGVDSDGDAMGIHQMGFVRGLPTVPGKKFSLGDIIRFGGGAAVVTGGLLVTSVATGGIALIVVSAFVVANLIVGLLSKNKNISKDLRVASGPRSEIIFEGNAALGTGKALPLYMYVQSGSYNDSSNNKKADHRMEAELSFIQGTGAAESDVTTVPMVFETIPEETVTDNIVFWEVGTTYKCENGIHYGEDPNNHQLIDTVPPTEAGSETSEVIKGVTITLDYTNTIAFNNGIESSAIGDEYGRPQVAQGAKASITLEDFEQEENVATLIYSGEYNSSTNINDLNVFSSAEVGNRNILKELDTNFGSIQRLYAENRYLYTFQEDKVSRVQIGRQTLYNSDGTTNVAASRNFLGEEEPISGEYGISTNPESFAVYGKIKYWSDKSRGVMLEMEGNNLQEISQFGMEDYFRDELANAEVVIGSYDDYHNQYIVTLREPFIDPKIAIQNIPLLLSRQGFLSRSDACRFPENKIQFTEVYEFYTEGEPRGFQAGDIIYYDLNRTSVYNGDDDWFIWFDSYADLPVTAAAAVTGNQCRIEFDTQSGFYQNAGVDFVAELVINQPVKLQSKVNPSTVYDAVVTQTGVESVNIVFASTTVFETGDDLVGAEFDFEVDLKYVINIDNFGVVRRKLNCVGIQPLNHDAFRASISGYQSPQEACGNGIVGRILYHNGDDATPDIGDYIYDSPYASDEYVEVYQNYLVDFPYNLADRTVFADATYEAIQEVPAGITPADSSYWMLTDIPVEYKKGRTARSGWYQIFDGADFEDYVIFIVRGIVVDKIRCAAIEAGRTSILVGDRVAAASNFPLLGRDEYSARVCRELPTEQRFHDGENVLPEIGDTLFNNNYTSDTLIAGSYSLPGGYYIEVNSTGTVSAIFQCIIRQCIRDLVNTYGTNDGLMNEQLNTTGVFTFQGVIDEAIYSTTDRQLAANATIRWSARGAERYPSNPNDFYEFTFNTNDGALIPNEALQLSNADFVNESEGETNLEYSILELCYDRNLVPQNITFTYYAPNNLMITDYPNASASTALARIFDLSGNPGTGTVEVTEPIFYDRTSTVRTYYTDEVLTPLDGTNGTTVPLWWAFGTEDNSAATQSCLISKEGLVLECRDRAHPFEFDLGYNETGELDACVETNLNLFLTDTGDAVRVSRDFENVTSMRTLTGAIPPSGYYTHLEQDGTATEDDDQNLVRYWNALTETFEARWPSNTPDTADNCPISLTAIPIRFSTNEQTAVCGSGVFTTAYISTSAAAFSALTDIIVWRGAFGTDAFEAGWFTDSNNATWYWDGVSTIVQDHTACLAVCSDPDASNTGANGDCYYPTVCTNSSANNYNSNPNAKFNTSNTAPVCDFRAVGCTDSTAYNYDPSAEVNSGCMYCASLAGQNAGGDFCSGVDLYTYQYTGTGTGSNCGTEQVLKQSNSPTCQFSCPSAGTSDGTASRCVDGDLVQSQYTGVTPAGASSNANCPVSDVVIQASAPACTTISGCTDSSASNYNAAATVDDGSCSYAGYSGSVGSSADNACDLRNSGVGGVATVSLTTDSSGTFYNAGALFTGWVSNSDNTVRSFSNGTQTSTGNCQAYPRITTVSISVNNANVDTSLGDTLNGVVSWTGVGIEADGVTVSIQATALGSATAASQKSGSYTYSISGSFGQPVGQYSVTATVSAGSHSRRASAIFNIV